MVDEIESTPTFVIGTHHIPGRESSVSRFEHVIPRSRVVVPAAVRLQIHRRKLPDLAAVINTISQSSRLLLRTDFEPVFEQDDSRIDDGTLNQRHSTQKAF